MRFARAQKNISCFSTSRNEAPNDMFYVDGYKRGIDIFMYKNVLVKIKDFVKLFDTNLSVHYESEKVVCLYYSCCFN